MSRMLRMTAATITFATALPAVAQTVTITTAGGDYGTAIKEAMWAPAAAELGLEVREETQSDGLAALKMQVTSGAVSSDIVHLGSPEGAQAAAQGQCPDVRARAQGIAPRGSPALKPAA